MMKHVWRNPFYKKRFLAFVMVCTILTGALLPSLSAKASPADFVNSLKEFFSGELTEAEIAEGYYGLSENAAAAFAEAQAKGTVNYVFGQSGNSIPTNGAGALIGFYDDGPSFDLGAVISSYSSSEYSYSMLFGKDSEWNSDNMVFAPYVVLGTVLSDLGIDRTGAKSGGTNIVRLFTGGAMMFVYTLSSIVPQLFSLVIDVLQMLNPFQFFYKTEGSAIMTGEYGALEGEAATDALRGITDVVDTWYQILYNMGPFIITFFACLMVVTVMLSKRARHDMSTYKKWIIRTAFIVLGIPVLGSTYNVFLSELDSMVGGSNMAAVKVIASSFCDFEAFANAGLQYTGSLRININDDSIHADKSMNPQKVCFDINLASNAPLDSGWSIYSGGEDDAAGFANMVENIQVQNAINDAHVGTWVFDMLERYAKGSKVSASTYSGKAASKMWMQNADGQPEKQAALASFLMTYSTPKGFEDARSSGFTSIFYTGGAKKSNGQWYGSESNSRDSEKINPFKVDQRGPVTSKDSWVTDQPDDAVVVSYGTGWAPNDIAVYNYLRTTFGNNSLTVYSPKNASSDVVKWDHYSVNLVGTGIQSLMIFLTCMAMLSSYTVIGIFYSMGLIMTNLRRSVQLILSVPLAMIGSLKAIARIITYTVVMLIEVVAVMIAYSLITNLIFSLTQAFNGMLNTTLGTLFGIRILPVLSIFTTIFHIWFLILAIKLRKNLVRSLDQGAEAIISKFIIGEAMHTGALNSKELTPVRQLGEKPEKTFGQRVGGAALKAGGAAVQGVMAAGMIASGNLPGGIAKAVNAAKGMKGAAEEAADNGSGQEDEGLKEYAADDPMKATGKIENKLKGLPGPVENPDSNDPPDASDGGDTPPPNNPPDGPDDPNPPDNKDGGDKPVSRSLGGSGGAPKQGGSSSGSSKAAPHVTVQGQLFGTQQAATLTGGSGGEGDAGNVTVQLQGFGQQKGAGGTAAALGKKGTPNVNVIGGESGGNGTPSPEIPVMDNAQPIYVEANSKSTGGQAAQAVGGGNAGNAAPVIIEATEETMREIPSEPPKDTSKKPDSSEPTSSGWGHRKK